MQPSLVGHVMAVEQVDEPAVGEALAVAEWVRVAALTLELWLVSRRFSIWVREGLHRDSRTDINGVSEKVAESSLIVQAFAARDD